jgi:hypothetical protein
MQIEITGEQIEKLLREEIVKHVSRFERKTLATPTGFEPVFRDLNIFLILP